MSNVYHVAIRITGKINDEDFTGSGESVGDRTLGNPEVAITYSKVPKGSNVLGNFIAVVNMLSTLLSKEIPPAKSLLSLTGGEYSFARSVQGPNVSLQTTGTMERSGANDLILTSRISGTISQPLSATADRWQGVQIPDGPGRIREVMIVPIRLGKNGEETVYVLTDYLFNPIVALPSIQVREVEFRPKLTDLKLEAGFKASIRTAATVWPVHIGKAQHA